VLDKHALATGSHLSVCLETEENQKNLCRDGRSQDLPVTYRNLSSSPANSRMWGFPELHVKETDGLGLSSMTLLWGGGGREGP
jgi:hypothetical protein